MTRSRHVHVRGLSGYLFLPNMMMVAYALILSLPFYVPHLASDCNPHETPLILSLAMSRCSGLYLLSPRFDMRTRCRSNEQFVAVAMSYAMPSSCAALDAMVSTTHRRLMDVVCIRGGIPSAGRRRQEGQPLDATYCCVARHQTWGALSTLSLFPRFIWRLQYCTP